MITEIQYLHHSGFLIKTQRHYLIFDYDGIPPKFSLPLTERNIIVFASHRHADHYHPEILRWKEKNPDIQVILSFDIPAKQGCLSIYPGETLKLNGITVTALSSTDEGVAFLVETDGITIYHAGDLNWWHWNGESDSYNTEMKQRYQKEIAKLSEKEIDFAFVPLDPRLEDAYLYGLDFFANTVHAKTIFPMHMWGDHQILKRLKNDPRAKGYAASVADVTDPGQVFYFNR